MHDSSQNCYISAPLLTTFNYWVQWLLGKLRPWRWLLSYKGHQEPHHETRKQHITSTHNGGNNQHENRCLRTNSSLNPTKWYFSSAKNNQIHPNNHCVLVVTHRRVFLCTCTPLAPSSQYAVTNVRNENCTQGKSPYVVILDFHTIRNFS